MNQQPNFPEPVGPPQAYQTYAARRPRATHTRTATCSEVDCQHSARGWKTVIDVSTSLGAEQAKYIRLHCGRHFTHTQAGTVVTFMFPAGQTCFTEHRVPIDRPALYVVRSGTLQSDFGVIRRHRNSDDFLDDIHNHTDRLSVIRQRG